MSGENVYENSIHGGALLIYASRLKFLTIFFTILFLGLVGKLLYLQVMKNDILSQQVTQQRAIETPLKDIRGNIYDRNMIPFTDREDKFYVIVIPNLIKDAAQVYENLSNFTGYTIQQIKETLNENRPVTFVIDNYSEEEISNYLNQPGIKMIRLSKRYGHQSLARHIIGYVNGTDQLGYSGIEKAFNQYLDINKKMSIGMIGDAVKRSITGLGYRVVNCFNNDDHSAVRLTLDYHIQDIIEEIIDKRMESGAVILTDIKTGDILGLASRPNYSQNQIERYLGSKGSELVNKAFSAYDAGSVFKIVVSAAAFEKNIAYLDMPFNCTGYIEVDGKKFTCHKEEGHGEMSFIQGFAYSCNPLFIDTGLKLGYQSIISMAERFGFGSTVSLFDGLEQQSGNIPNKKYVSPREIANISIGQGEILVTPIQVVDMVTTIANNGVRKKLNIVDAIVNDNGNVIKQLRYEDDTRIISEEIAKKIQKMMEEVTISGTGQNARLEEYGGAAGKTGSAETGWMVNGKTKVHAWFVGYFPVTNPKYAMVVFVEDGRQGGAAAAPIFREIAENVLELNY
ncbi:MAG: penicillin-binding protein 2 [Clostridiales bacterium]|nr:penicillin-binding protein 2 [Clostridiales bacterium]